VNEERERATGGSGRMSCLVLFSSLRCSRLRTKEEEEEEEEEEKG